MAVDLVAEFFRHNSMMNQRLLDVCRHLSTEQLAATAPGTYGSIGATLVHIANSQQGYVPRFLRPQRPDPLPEHPFPGIEVVIKRFVDGDAWLQRAAVQHDSDQEVEVSGDDPPGRWRMPASLFLLQAINHGTEHRSQVSTILTQLGVDPPGMDGWAYFFASGHMVPI